MTSQQETPSDSSLSKDDCKYRMDHPRRGVAVIFNQEKFDNSPLIQREGSEKDCVSLENSFGRLGFDVKIYRDLTMAGIEDRLLELSEREEHSNCDCFVLAFMSHGMEGKLRCKDGQFDVNLLWDSFTAERCPSLANKPKIFIIQACQGHGRQESVLVSAPNEAMGSEIREAHVRLVPSYSLPVCADFLIALSTIPGFVSWRNPQSGSWYIQTLCRQLDKYGFSKEMLSLLTGVSHAVALEYTFKESPTDKPKKQLPCIISMLIRELKFTEKPKSKPRVNRCRKRRHQALEDSDSDEEEG